MNEISFYGAVVRLLAMIAPNGQGLALAQNEFTNYGTLGRVAVMIFNPCHAAGEG